MRLLLAFRLLVLLLIQPWLVAGHRKISDSALESSRFDWQGLFRDDLETKKMPREVTVREPADSRVGVHETAPGIMDDPFDARKVIFQVETPTAIKFKPAITGDMMFYDELPGKRGGFELENSHKHASILCLITTHGIWVARISTSIEDLVLRPKDKKRIVENTSKIDRSPARIAKLKGFDWWVNWLLLGEETGQTQPKGKPIKVQADVPLAKFLEKLKKEKKGEPLHLLTITQPESAPLEKRNPWVFDAIVWKVQKVLKDKFDSDLKPLSLTMDMGTTDPAIVNKFGVYTYRGEFTRLVNDNCEWRGLKAQFVSAIYGNKGGFSMMIPQESERSPEGSLLTDIPHEIPFSPTKPQVDIVNWKDRPTTWFSSVLDPKLKNLRSNVLLVLTTYGYWRLSVPMDYVAESNTYMDFTLLVNNYLSTNPEEGKGLAAFLANPESSGKILGYCMLYSVDRKTTNPFNYRFLAALWTRINQQVQQNRGDTSLDKVHGINVGQSTDQKGSRNHFVVEVTQATGTGFVTYQNEQKLRIGLDPASLEEIESKSGEKSAEVKSFTLAELEKLGERFLEPCVDR